MPTEFVLTETGAIMRRDINEREIDLSHKLVASLTKNSSVTIPRLFEVPEYGFATLTAKPGEWYLSVPVSRLIIKAPWRLVEGLLVPNFGGNNDPVMTITWPVPDNIKVKIVVLAGLYDENVLYCMTNMWLFAFDERGAAYRLPLANIHDDCHVCHGQKDIIFPTLAEILSTCLKRFEISKYNADLWKSAEQTQQFFRMKPGHRDSFEAQPISVDWTKLCIKVANQASKYAL